MYGRGLDGAATISIVRDAKRPSQASTAIAPSLKGASREPIALVHCSPRSTRCGSRLPKHLWSRRTRCLPAPAESGGRMVHLSRNQGIAVRTRAKAELPSPWKGGGRHLRLSCNQLQQSRLSVRRAQARAICSSVSAYAAQGCNCLRSGSEPMSLSRKLLQQSRVREHAAKQCGGICHHNAPICGACQPACAAVRGKCWSWFEACASNLLRFSLARGRLPGLQRGGCAGLHGDHLSVQPTQPQVEMQCT